ncbi:MAG: hypothetical protein ACQEUT_08970 [Bacillota bacterium]
MDFSIWMYITVFLSQLVGVALAFAIFTSIYLKNKAKGLVSLAITFLLVTYSLIQGFNASIILGVGMMIIIIGLSIVTYFMLQKKMKNEVT